jgi:hypothetical protein
MGTHNVPISMTRSEYIKVYLTEEEEKQVKEAADNADRPVSSYARRKLKEGLPQEVEA